MMFVVLRRSLFVSLFGACAVLVFSAVGFAQTVHDDFETVDPAWMSDGKGSTIAGGKLRSNYDSLSWYEGVDLLDLHVEVTLEVNEGQFSPDYDPNFPAGAHLALGARGIYDPGILAGGRVIMANMVTYDPGTFPTGELNGPRLYFHELPSPAGFGPAYELTHFGESRDAAGLTRDFNGEIKMEMWVEGTEVEFKVTELDTGWEASIQHTLANVCAGCGEAYDNSFPGEVGLFASNTYGRSTLQEPNLITYQEWDNFCAAEIGETCGATTQPGDTEPDGDVDGKDFLGSQLLGASAINDWKGSYPIPAPLSGVAAVPEPAGCALLLAGGALLIVRAMRRGDSK